MMLFLFDLAHFMHTHKSTNFYKINSTKRDEKLTINN
jgi:hypothetical protein